MIREFLKDQKNNLMMLAISLLLQPFFSIHVGSTYRFHNLIHIATRLFLIAFVFFIVNTIYSIITNKSTGDDSVE